MIKAGKIDKKPIENTRMCIACRAKRSRNELVRLYFDGEKILINPKCSVGRGAGVCKSLTCIKNAFGKKAFDRAFKAKIDSDELLRLEERLSKMEEF